MKKLFTLAAAVLASVSMWAATVDDLATISADYNVYFEDVVTSNVSAGTLITDYVLSQIANTYKTDQGTDATVGKKYCLRVKNTSQDVLAFKVSSSCTLVLYANRATDRTPYLDTKVAAQGESSITGTPTATDGRKGYVTYSIPAAGTYYIIGNGSDCYLAGLEFSDFCTDPEAHLAFTQSTAYVGEQFSYNFGSLNGGALTTTYTLNDAPAVQGTDYTFSSGNLTVLKAGQFVMRMTIDAEDGYCAVDVSDTILINAATQVESVTIAGPTAGYDGYTLTYTAEAENATTYEWYVDGFAANNNSATFNYTAVKGNHAIKATASNKFTTTPVESNTINVAVSSLYGELIAATAETGSGSIDKNITATGIVGGTVHQKTQKNAKLGGEGHYFSLTLAAGSFAAGDTVKVVVAPEYNSQKETYSAPSQLKISTVLDNTNLIGESETKTIDPTSSADLYFDIVLTEGASTIYLARDGSICKQNPIVKSIAVVRPMPVKTTAETLTAVSVNEVVISAADLATLQADHAVALTASYAAAPKVAFTKHIVITYEDDSKKESDAVIEVTAEENADGKWEAKATINAIEYVVTAEQEASATITYMDGENKLGEEVVAVGAHPAEFAQYKSKSLATFVAWYSDAALENAVTIEEAVITQDTTFYAKWTYLYAESVNIEQLVLDNGTNYDLESHLGTKHYASNWTNDLDSLNDDKDSRNEPYLGQKVKKAGKMLDFRLAKDSELKVKFGNVPADVKVIINDVEYTVAKADLAAPYEYTATEETYISIRSTTDATLVFKQIMINEDIQVVTLPYGITCSATENGTLSAKKSAIPGEKVVITATPAEGYKTALVLVNGTRLTLGEEISFDMPAKNVTITGEFTVSGYPTALGNTDADNKAIKTIENSQIVIIKNGVRYNVLGAELR